MDVQSPELPGRLSLRLDVYSPPQVLQIDGRLCHLVLAFLVVGDFTNSRAPSLHGSYPASTLLRTHPSPSRLRSTSRLSRLYDRQSPICYSADRMPRRRSERRSPPKSAATRFCCGSVVTELSRNRSAGTGRGGGQTCVGSVAIGRVLTTVRQGCSPRETSRPPRSRGWSPPGHRLAR